MLDTYLQQVQRLIGYDERQLEYNPDDLITFINMARRQVAAEGECVRWLTPAGGSIESVEVLTPGANYPANTTISISPPDQPPGDLPNPSGLQATARPIVNAGQIASVSITNGGDGYFSALVTANGDPGSGATFKPHFVQSANKTLFGQDLYRFTDIALGPDAGVKTILQVRSVTIYWGTWRYKIQFMSVGKFLKYSVYNNYYQTPAIACQYGQGENGSIRFYPIPDQSYPMQWDCLCIPDDLIDDNSPEAIPDPWRDAVPIYASYLAMLGMAAKKPQFTPLADKFYNIKDGGLFRDMMRRARAFSQPSQSARSGW